MARAAASRFEWSEGGGIREYEQRGRSKELRYIAERFIDNVRSAQSHRIPLLPAVAMRAMEIAQDGSASIRQIESVVTPDAVLTARILAIANSPLYGTARQIWSLRNAIQMLGVDTLRDVLYQAVAEAHIFRGEDERALRAERLHAVACAYLCRMVGKKTQESHDHCFLAGLMHDIGYVIIRQFTSGPRPALDLEPRERDWIISMIHPVVGQMVCDRWTLPKDVGEAALRHHSFREGEDPSLMGEVGTQWRASGIGATVGMANLLATHSGVSHDGRTEADLLEPISEVGQELGIDEDNVLELVNQAAELKEKILGNK